MMSNHPVIHHMPSAMVRTKDFVRFSHRKQVIGVDQAKNLTLDGLLDCQMNFDREINRN